MATVLPCHVLKPCKPAAITVQDSTQIGRPQPVVDGNQNPLLKIDGNSATIWQYTLATLSSLNHSIVGQSKNRYEATIKVDQQIYVLRLDLCRFEQQPSCIQCR